MSCDEMYDCNKPILRFQQKELLTPQISTNPRYFCIKCDKPIASIFSPCSNSGCGWNPQIEKYCARYAIKEYEYELESLSLSYFCEWSSAYFDKDKISKRRLTKPPPKEILIGRISEYQFLKDNKVDMLYNSDLDIENTKISLLKLYD